MRPRSLAWTPSAAASGVCAPLFETLLAALAYTALGCNRAVCRRHRQQAAQGVAGVDLRRRAVPRRPTPPSRWTL
jgi:hypothetical protein